MPQIAVLARVRVKEGKGNEFLAAFASLLPQTEKEPGTLLYVVQRSNDDPQVFWTSEIYPDEPAFEVHCGSDVYAAATPVFTDLIAESDVVIDGWDGPDRREEGVRRSDLPLDLARDHSAGWPPLGADWPRLGRSRWPADKPSS